MVADIHLLQGKIIDDPEQRTKNISRMIEELALEILNEEDLGIAAATPAPRPKAETGGTGDGA